MDVLPIQSMSSPQLTDLVPMPEIRQTKNSSLAKRSLSARVREHMRSAKISSKWLDDNIPHEAQLSPRKQSNK
ncbi:hypothetical protein ACH5RR_008899 [Cinchona calisaya]|uniref:Uncharacterized protein n=1 Tax=Cinchona calisaya TaxID=153742 RepID=A0ABD3AGH2_9GENT